MSESKVVITEQITALNVEASPETVVVEVGITGPQGPALAWPTVMYSGNPLAPVNNDRRLTIGDGGDGKLLKLEQYKVFGGKNPPPPEWQDFGASWDTDTVWDFVETQIIDHAAILGPANLSDFGPSLSHIAVGTVIDTDQDDYAVAPGDAIFIFRTTTGYTINGVAGGDSRHGRILCLYNGGPGTLVFTNTGPTPGNRIVLPDGVDEVYLEAGAALWVWKDLDPGNDLIGECWRVLNMPRVEEEEGPGPEPTPGFDPVAIEGLVAYFDSQDARRENYATSLMAYGWEERSRRRDARPTNNDGAHAPDIIIGATPTGRPSASFDSSGEAIQTDTFDEITGPYTVLLAAKLTGGTYMCSGSGAHDGGVFGTNGGKFAAYAGSFLLGPDTDTDWHLFSAIFDGADSSFRIDGTEVASGNAGSSTIDQVVLGGYTGNVAAAECEIAGYLLIDGSPDNLAEIEAWALDRWLGA